MTDPQALEALRRGEFGHESLRAALGFRGESAEALFALARAKRLEAFPEGRVQVRSVVETSNVCRQHCRYCAIGGKEQDFNYTLGAAEMFSAIKSLHDGGRSTILLQSGENVSQDFIEATAEAVGKATRLWPELTVILCMGNMERAQYQLLREAGATHYILKFETSDPDLFAACKPNDSLANRLECIFTLADVGFKVGSGNIVGLPGQTPESIVSDLKLIHKLPLAMNSSTVFIPAENTPFEAERPGDAHVALNMMALMRIMNPARLMPTTSSLEKSMADGQYLGLMAGANTVTIHDGTPAGLEQHFPIYSARRVRPQIEHFRNILTRAGISTDNLK